MLKAIVFVAHRGVPDAGREPDRPGAESAAPRPVLGARGAPMGLRRSFVLHRRGQGGAGSRLFPYRGEIL